MRLKENTGRGSDYLRYHFRWDLDRDLPEPRLHLFLFSILHPCHAVNSPIALHAHDTITVKPTMNVLVSGTVNNSY